MTGFSRLAIVLGSISSVGCAWLLGFEEGQPEAERCTSNTECAPNAVCSDSQCRTRCSHDPDCESTDVCIDSQCRPVIRPCEPGDSNKCHELTPQICNDQREWVPNGPPCSTNCVAGVCDDVRSCDGGLTCGADRASCCQALLVAGGTFSMQYALPGESPRAVVRTVSAFALDRFEVTIGRFRQFVEAYDSLGPAKVGSGAHPKIAGSGWQERWNGSPDLARTRYELEHELSLCGAWRDVTQDLPARCVSWYSAMRFCIWDNGRLPTEAEWTFAAAAGDEGREYPWQEGEIDGDHARYTPAPPAMQGPIRVGQLPSGRGKYLHDDLAGNVSEWVVDWYRETISHASCIDNNSSTVRRGTTRDCIDLEPTDQRVVKGGSYLNSPEVLKTYSRQGGYPVHVTGELGFRCARDPR